MKKTVTDEKGAYSFFVEKNKMYSVRAELESKNEKDKYKPNEKTITTNANPKDCENNLDIALEKEKCKVSVGDDLADCFGIKYIYFDLDKSNIRTEAALDLAKILVVLSDYPNMKIDIRSHTDSRASRNYNEALSQRRAKSTRQWLIKKGINPNRLTAKGYGETRLLNKCSDGVKCTEKEHQLNRRSEFIIKAL